MIGIESRLFSSRLRRTRMAAGFTTRKALADACGLNQSTLGQIEALKAWPNERYQKELERVLNRPAEWLFPVELRETLEVHGFPRVAEHEISIQQLATSRPLLTSGGFEVVDQELDREKLHLILGSLSPRKRDIIERRYGIGRDEQTLREIGDDLGISVERVRQIQVSAERNLRHPSRTKWFTDRTAERDADQWDQVDRLKYWKEKYPPAAKAARKIVPEWER